LHLPEFLGIISIIRGARLKVLARHWAALRLSSGKPTDMKQKDTSTHPLSWPDTASTKEWIVVFTVSAVVYVFLFLLFPILSLLVGEKDWSLICRELVQGFGSGAFISVATMTFGVALLREKNFSARAKRKRISKSLGAIIIGAANCSTPAILNASSDVVLVLTRYTFAVYGKQPLVKDFECPLSNIVGTATHKDNPVLPLDSIEITFKGNDKTLVGRFHKLQEIDGEEWAYKIAALR
jgi:hypothetical protein